MSHRIAATLVACLIAPAAAAAATLAEIDARALPPGLSRDKAISLLQAAETAMADESRQEREALRRRSQRIEAVGRKYQTRIDQAVAADPALRQRSERLRERFAALGGLGEAQRGAELQQLQSEAAALRPALLARAGIDTAELQNELRNAAMADVAPRGISQPQVKVTENGAIVIEHPTTPEPPEVGRRGLVESVTLTKPFPSDIRIYDGNDSNYGKTDKAAGTYETRVSVANGKHSYSRMGLAHFVIVPSGARTMRVIAKLPDMSFSAEVGTSPMSWGSRSKVATRLEVWRGSTRLCRSYRVHAELDAGWYVVGLKRDGVETVSLDCTVTAPAAGSEITILFASGADISTPYIGFAAGKATGKPASIRVDFST